MLAVYTGEDLAAAKVGGLPCGWLITDVNGQPMKEPPYPRARAGQGAPRRRARRGRDRRDRRPGARRGRADRRRLRSAARGRRRRQGQRRGAPLHEIAPDNTCYVWALGDKAAVDAAFAKAAHVTKLEFVNNRLIPNAIEPRAANAIYSRADDGYTLYVASQNPHVERLLMTAFVLGLPEQQGARGRARRRRRLRLEDLPLRRGRGRHLGVEAAQPPGEVDLRPLAKPSSPTRTAATTSRSPSSRSTRTASSSPCACTTTANLGAYLSTFASCIPTILYATLLAGPVHHAARSTAK